MISIIIPNYNRVHYLEACLQSVMAQSYDQWEALVVDDGSTDSSKDLVKRLAQEDRRIHWIEHSSHNKGASVCRNLGIQRAQGNYIIFLDSDDLLGPHCLVQRMAIMEAQPQLDFSVFKMQFFKEQPGDDKRLWNLDNGEDPLQRFLNLDAVWQTSGPIWKRAALLKIGGFNENLQCWQDIDIHVKALIAQLKYKICYNLPVDCYYRKNATQTISQSNTGTPEKLNSKASLYHWIVEKLGNSSYNYNQMALHILISAVTAYNKKFFNTFYHMVKDLFPTDIKKSIKIMGFLQFYRLTKLVPFKKQFVKIKEQLILPSQIGTHNINED